MCMPDKGNLPYINSLILLKCGWDADLSPYDGSSFCSGTMALCSRYL